MYINVDLFYNKSRFFLKDMQTNISFFLCLLGLSNVGQPKWPIHLGILFVKVWRMAVLQTPIAYLVLFLVHHQLRLAIVAPHARTHIIQRILGLFGARVRIAAQHELQVLLLAQYEGQVVQPLDGLVAFVCEKIEN